MFFFSNERSHHTPYTMSAGHSVKSSESSGDGDRSIGPSSVRHHQQQQQLQVSSERDRARHQIDIEWGSIGKEKTGGFDGRETIRDRALTIVFTHHQKQQRSRNNSTANSNNKVPVNWSDMLPPPPRHPPPPSSPAPLSAGSERNTLNNDVNRFVVLEHPTVDSAVSAEFPSIKNRFQLTN